MPLEQLINRPCTLLLKSQLDEPDDFTEGPEDPAPEVDTVCYLEQVQRDEPEDQGELSITLWRFVFKADEEAINTADAVRVPGEGIFEFRGDPWTAENPRTKQVSHVEASAVRTGKVDEEGS